MRVLKTLLGAALLIGVTGASALAATRPPKPPLVHLHWHRVASRVTDWAANDSYFVYRTPAGITLVDQATHVATELSEAECPNAQFGVLGGPWLVCPYPQVQPPTSPNASDTRLYNIPGNYSLTVPGPPCAQCFPQAVGSDWIEFIEPVNLEHEVPTFRLQNISTGQTEPDPAKVGARFAVDLDSATGTIPLCPPLRDPAFFDDQTGQREPGEVAMLGQFALMTGFFSDTALLERCGSNRRLTLRGEAIGGSRMVVWNNSWIDAVSLSPIPGLLLPSTQRFRFSIPRRFDPGISELHGVAVSGRTIYVVDARRTLWAATVPDVR